MPVQITLPVSQENIKPELARLHGELKRVKFELDSIRRMIAAVQDCCEHDTKHYTDRSGVGCSYCTICNKEW